MKRLHLCSGQTSGMDSMPTSDGVHTSHLNFQELVMKDQGKAQTQRLGMNGSLTRTGLCHFYHMRMADNLRHDTCNFINSM